jgi:predicted nucleic acid-binding protein
VSGFLLDTNIISAFVKPEANKPVIDWLEAAASETLFVSVITVGDLRLGIENLPTGKRRSQLEQWLETGLPDWFETNLLPVTMAIGERWGRMTIEAKRNGMTLGTPDGLIAATAAEHDLSVVTRNVKDFEGLGVSILNPW